MVTKRIIIQNKTGIHARPASDLVNLCKQFPCDIKILANGKAHDAKKIMNLLLAGLVKGTELTVQTNGQEEKEALEKVTAFILDLKE
ncbi:HPr family phosphocarrier protein [Intestinibacillus sp. Marseille-P6563]|uniref:HPr family phosphocarrier protein n=1 Tax=Intestinibacillus sp. Marseille-P6563 TaxID=2364792 RepID=UPI000F0603BF|nr:HPr family phosphocarrier protein [Intestinibacillus sp. Marseille-P6563]